MAFVDLLLHPALLGPFLFALKDEFKAKMTLSSFIEGVEAANGNLAAIFQDKSAPPSTPLHFSSTSLPFLFHL